MTTKDKLIEKQKELIEFQKLYSVTPLLEKLKIVKKMQSENAELEKLAKQDKKEKVTPKKEEIKPQCKWRDQFDFCHSLSQMGDDCEGICPAFEKGNKRFTSRYE
jgi:hypothetical protein